MTQLEESLFEKHPLPWSWDHKEQMAFDSARSPVVDFGGSPFGRSVRVRKTYGTLLGKMMVAAVNEKYGRASRLTSQEETQP